MEASSNDVRHSVGSATNIFRYLASRYHVRVRVYLYGFGRNPYQRLLPRVSGADYKMPSMRLSLVMDCLSKATPEMVRLVEDSDKLPHVPITRPTHDIATNQSRPCVRDQVQRATLDARAGPAACELAAERARPRRCQNAEQLPLTLHMNISNLAKVDVENQLGATTVRLQLSVPCDFGSVIAIAFLAKSASRIPFEPNAVAAKLTARVHTGA
jgi:hypothetical protein